MASDMCPLVKLEEPTVGSTLAKLCKILTTGEKKACDRVSRQQD